MFIIPEDSEKRKYIGMHKLSMGDDFPKYSLDSNSISDVPRENRALHSISPCLFGLDLVFSTRGRFGSDDS